MKVVIVSHAETFCNVAKMCEELYANVENNTVIAIGINQGESYSQFKRKFPNQKIICYQLEQLFDNGSMWFNKNTSNKHISERTRHIEEWLDNCDEIWDYDLDNVSFLQSLGYKNVKFRPMRYCESLKIKQSEVKDIDVLFYGSMNERRRNHLKKLNVNLKICDASSSAWGKNLDNLISRSKVILNLHYYETELQEQVRLFPLIINDCCVLSEKSRYNYYEGLITEFDDIVESVDYLLKDNNWKTVSSGISEKFRNRNFKIGASYNVFYGCETLKKSIASISPIVDYVVLVNQKVSFTGEKQSEANALAMNSLSKKCEVVEYGNENKDWQGVIDKRNIGLQKCKENGCDFILPLDTDELYDCSALWKDINKMYLESIDTMYSPIQTYYYDEEHFFDDTYFVPTAYRIDDRLFTYVKSSVLADYERKLEEKKYFISNYPMKHLCYLKDDYKEKVQSKRVIPRMRKLLEDVSNYMNNWKDGMPAKVFTNDPKNSAVVIAMKDLRTKQKVFSIKTSHSKKCVNAVVISLERNREGRLRLFKSKFKYNMSLNVIDAVDGLLEKVPVESKLKPGTYGCLLSHIKAIEFAKINNFQNVLILEDDVRFIQNFQDVLNITMLEMPDDWDCLWLGGHDQVAPINYSLRLNRLMSCWGAYGYILRNTVYDFFIERLRSELLPCDNVYKEYQKDFNSFKTKRQYVIHNHTQSVRISADNGVAI